MGSRRILLWLANIVRGNSQQVKMARGPEILSTRNRGLAKLKSWRNIHEREKSVIKKPWLVAKVHICLAGAIKTVGNTEIQADKIISIVGGSGFLDYQCRGSGLWQLLRRGLERLRRLTL